MKTPLSHRPFTLTWLLLLILFRVGSALHGQNYEEPPTVTILTYTNLHYRFLEATQDWFYVEGPYSGYGAIREDNQTMFHRDHGGFRTNYHYWTSSAKGAIMQNWDTSTENSDSALWHGSSAPTIAWVTSCYSNYLTYPGLPTPHVSSDQSQDWETNYWYQPWDARKTWRFEDAPWTMLYNYGQPHTGYYEKWTNYTWTDTTLEVFSGGVTNSAADVTMELQVWVYDHVLNRYLAAHEFTVNGRAPDANGYVYFLMQDNQRLSLSFSITAIGTMGPGSMNGTDYSFWAYPARHHLRVGVDQNRDGTIDLDGTNDLTHAGSPYVFWVNNDNDKLGNPFGDDEVDWFDAETSGSAAFPNDYAWNFIHTERDLEDYSRIDIRLPALDLGTNWVVRLSFGGKLKFMVSPCDGFQYLMDPNLAHWMVYTNPTTWFVGATDSGTMILTPDYFTGGLCRLLWKAGTVSAGELKVELLQAGSCFASGRVHLNLRDIKDLYEYYTVGNAMSAGVDTSLVPAAAASGPSGGHFPEEDGKYLLLVHGWNMPAHEKRFFAETALKRLYWQGYKGRFGLFTWPTFYFNSFLFDDGIVNYDRSEHNAWRSGQPLLALLQQLDAQFPGQVRMMAHSMGNVPAGEALHLAGTNRVVHSYVAMQAAIPAHCYDGGPNVEPVGLGRIPVLGSLTTPNRYAEYYTNGCLPYLTNSAGAGLYHSYLNPEDFALVGLWDMNQRQKPDGTLGYHYSTPSGANVSGFYRIQTPYAYYLDFPTKTHEIFSFAAESHSVALGASLVVEGVFVRDGAKKLDLNFGLGFTREHRFHSGQFLSTIIQRWSFWSAMMGDLELN